MTDLASHEWGVETFGADFQRVTVGPLPEADARSAATLRFDGVLMRRPVGSETWEMST